MQMLFSVRTGACLAGWPAPGVLIVKEFLRDQALRMFFIWGNVLFLEYLLTESRRGTGR